MNALMRGLRGGLVVACTLMTPILAADLTYTYDELGRLTKVSYPSGYSITYAYDAAGNRTTVTSVGNSAPTAVDDNAATDDNTPLSFDPRINDTDPDNDPLTITAPGGTAVTTAHGSVTGTGSSVTYTPSNGFHGTDSFNYTITDGHSHTASALVTVTVNSPPIAVDDYVTARPDPAGNVEVTFDPTSNDTDPDNDNLSVKSVGAPTAPSHGTAQKNSGSSVTYTANPGYQGSDSFSYKVKDGQGHTSTATVHVTVI